MVRVFPCRRTGDSTSLYFSDDSDSLLHFKFGNERMAMEPQNTGSRAEESPILYNVCTVDLPFWPFLPFLKSVTCVFSMPGAGSFPPASSRCRECRELSPDVYARNFQRSLLQLTLLATYSLRQKCRWADYFPSPP
jgi:hypothetical protein